MNPNKITAALLFTLLLTLQSLAQDSTTPTTPATTTPPTSNEVIEILNRIESRSSSTKSLHAQIYLTKENPFLDDKQTRKGEIYYLAETTAPLPNPHPAQFKVHFTDLFTDNTQHSTLNHQYIFDGEWLVERKLADKQFTKQQIVGPNESYNPLSLDGAFPLPIAQKAADILKRFKVTLVPTTPKDDTLFANQPSIHLHLIPRKDAAATGVNHEFKSINLWYDAKTLDPLQVETINRNGVITTVRLKDLKPDTITDEHATQLFNTTPPIEQGWDVDITPWEK